MKYALIHQTENRIAQVTDQTFPVHNDLVWVECADDVTTKHSYTDGRFVAPTVIPQYQKDRESAYPSIADQLDQIYHEGIDAWKETIAAVKAEYPKP